MSLASPVWLLLLLPVALLAVGYVWQQARRSRYAVRFATLPMLERLAPVRPGWRRHLPAGILLLTFVALCVAAARPQVDEEVPRERATVMVVVDVSLSMEATDVDPDRLTAAREAAIGFVQGLPEGFNIGIVSFSGVATVLASPTPDQAAAVDALEGLSLDEGTAIGDGVLTSLAQLETVPEDDEGPVPAQIVLLSDGTNTVGSSVERAADAAVEAGVPVSTIAYGTAEGTVMVDGQLVPVPVDEAALASLADATSGEAYEAESAEQLTEVYDDIQSEIGFTTEQKDVTRWAVLVALVLGFLAAGLSLLWFARLP